MSQHLDALQINYTFQTLLGILRLLPAVATVLAHADAAAEQYQASDDSNADDRPKWN